MTIQHLVSSLAFALLVSSGSLHAGGVAILATEIEDNGDNDTFADTRETVQLRLLVQNTTGAPLAGVTLGLESVGPGRACVTDGTLAVGALAVGEILWTTEAFEIVVGDVDRTALGLNSLAAFTQALKVSVLSPGAMKAYPEEIDLDLDLNSSGGAGPTTFFESFENGLGAFGIENLDAGRSSLAASDGFRCQYADPANPNRNNRNNPPDSPTGDNFCFLGVSAAHADQIFWGLSGPEFSPQGGRGFSGFHSLFFGIDLGPPQEFTTPMATLEAVRMSQPVHLAWDVSPTLTIKHQISFLDDTVSNAGPGEAFDHGVLLVQLADPSSGDPVGSWIKIHPSTNVYDALGLSGHVGCTFDPIDDGNDEDDFFNPLDPARRYGPSSTCYPALSFARIGETSNPFAPANLGKADGPGLQGNWGIGTWIESRFDLGAFRGRSIRLRLLASMQKYGPTPSWESHFPGMNPNPGEDGWWIDDVTISGALTTVATLQNDDTNNASLPIPSDGDSDTVFDGCDNCVSNANADQSDVDSDGSGDVCDVCPGEAALDHDTDGLCGVFDNCPYVNNANQANADGDPFGDACDCGPTNAATYPGASEINDGLDNNCAGDAGFGATDEISGTIGFFTAGNDNLLSWPAQPGASKYEVARASTRNFQTGCTLFTATTATSQTDATAVPAGQIRYYLVRAKLPHTGSWGLTSAGAQRVVPCAP